MIRFFLIISILRFVYFLIKQPTSTLNQLSRQINSVKEAVSQCQRCFRYFEKEKNTKNLCPTCLDQNRDQHTLLVLEKDIDFENIRRADSYNGSFFILGGLLSFDEKDIEKKIRINELLHLLEKEKGQINEIILALSANTEGDHTTNYLQKRLTDISKKNNIKVSTLGKGLSTGVEIEYSDLETFRNALENRH